jgi:hypothetical protein
LGGDFAPPKPESTTITGTVTRAGILVSWHASIPTPTAPPTSLTVSGGMTNYTDSTTGFTVNLPKWSKIQGNSDFLANGPASSLYFNLLAVWGGSIRSITKIGTTIRDANTIGNRIIFDDIAPVTSAADIPPPTLTFFEDNKSGGPTLVKEPVT